MAKIPRGYPDHPNIPHHFYLGIYYFLEVISRQFFFNRKGHFELLDVQIIIFLYNYMKVYDYYNVQLNMQLLTIVPYYKVFKLVWRFSWSSI